MTKANKETVRLYDLRKSNYPDQRGDVFRSLQVFECWVCGARTNRIVMGGYPGYGVRVICPNSCECWHHVLEHKLDWLGRPHPQDYKASLEREIASFRERYNDRMKNDIIGEPNPSLKGEVTNTQSFRTGSFCEHEFGGGSFDEASIERAERKLEKARKIEPDQEIERMIAREGPYVKARVRIYFYGDDLHAQLFPRDEFGPHMQMPDGGEECMRIDERADVFIDRIRKSPKLFARTRVHRGIDKLAE